MSLSSDIYAQAQCAVDRLNTPPLDTLPVLLARPPRREAHRRALQAARLAIESECTAIDKLMETLRTRKQQALMRHAAIVQALSPVSALSPELLSTIFLHAVTGLTCAKRISHVCGYWRHVAITTSALWTNVLLGYLPDSLATIRLLEACITRSSGRPLSAWVRAPSPLCSHLCMDTNVRSRLQELHVQLPQGVRVHQGMSSITGLLGTRCYPALQALTVVTSDREDRQPLDVLWFPDVFPSLSTLRLFGDNLPDLEQLGPTLSSLSLHYSPRKTPATDTVSQVQKCLNLSFLEVEGEINGDDRDDHSGPPISLLQLRQMRLLGCRKYMTIGILDAIRAPALLHLHLDLSICDFDTDGSSTTVKFVC